MTERKYEDIELEYEKHAQKLLDIVKSLNETIEGNYYTEHTRYTILKDNESKRKNLFSEALKHNVILEIGFNAGHSCLLYLLANPKAIIYCFDICEHEYVRPCFNYLLNTFKARMYLIEGDSTKTLLEFEPTYHPTLYHIDGCHFYNVAIHDIENIHNMARIGDILVLDDTDMDYIDFTWKAYIYKKKIRNLELKYPCSDTCSHSFGVKL